MNFREINEGDIFQKNTERDINNKGGMYEVLMKVEKVTGDYHIKNIILGRMGTDRTITVNHSELKKEERWTFIGQGIIEEVVQKRLKYPDGRIEVLSERLYGQEQVVELRKPEKKPTIVNVTNIVKPDDIPLGSVGLALKDAECKQAEVKAVKSWDTSVYSNLTYNELSSIGAMLADHEGVITNNLTRFQNSQSKILHQQCLDRFRENNITMWQLRKYCPYVGVSNKGTSNHISFAQVILRLAKAIYHYGTEEEKGYFNY